MRLGRSVAALGTTAALVAAGAAVSAPALADDGFTVSGATQADPKAPYSLSGQGCGPDASGQPGTVAWALGPAESPVATGTTPANADGSWSASIDLPALLAEGKVKDPSVVDLSVACFSYQKEPVDAKTGKVTIDSTALDGSYRLTTEADGSQTISTDVTGFAAGEQITFRVAPVDAYNREGGPGEGDFTTFATFGADDKGAASTTFTPPADLPDGKYKAGVIGSVYGETGWFEDILVKDGVLYATEDDPSDDATDGMQDPGATDASSSAAPVAPPAATAKPAAAPAPKGQLARTGAGLSLAVVAAGLLACGAVLTARRRA